MLTRLAEALELTDETVPVALVVTLHEVVPAEVPIVAAVCEQVPDDDEDGVTDGHRSLLLADPVQ